MANNIEQLRDLRDRVAKLTGPDREVDRQVFPTLFDHGNCYAPMGDALDWLDWHEPEFTASIDAVEALRQRMLPGWGLTACTSAGGRYPVVKMERSQPTNIEIAVEHHTEPLARLLAVLDALIAKGEE